MKFFDWLKNLGKPKPAEDAADAAAPKQRSKKPASGHAAADDPAVPGWRRKVLHDARYLPKPPKKNYWDKRDPVMAAATADRAFSPGYRTRNRAIRTLDADKELLAQRGLPVWTDEGQVADALGVSVGQLWWLASHRYDDRVMHYSRFAVPKRTGGHRVIMAPKRRLKAVQRTLLRELAAKLPVSEHAHGFLPGRSVATNAAPHVGKRVVVKFDLEDFFGTVTFGRVRGYLLAMGYGFGVATTLALLMTEAERQPVEVDGQVVHVPVGHRYCVQGAPTSPALCNAIASKLDQRLAGFARSIGFAYTRYADDLTFSGDDESKVGQLLRMVDEVVRAEGFRLKREKTRVMRSGGHQRVTGVTVNRVAGLSRQERRKLRAQIHGMSAGSSPEEIAALRGKLAYLQMLNPAQAEALRPDWLR